MIEGVKIETVRGKGWGMGRAFYKCPECKQARKTLYSGPESQCKAKIRGNGAEHSERTGSAGKTMVACSQHWPESKVIQDEHLLAARRADEIAASGQGRRTDRVEYWRSVAHDLAQAQAAL